MSLFRLSATLCFVVMGPQWAAANDALLIEEGKVIYQSICVECHGEDGSEGAGGDIRGSDFQQVRMATGGIEEMPEFEFSNEELKALVAYLSSI